MADDNRQPSPANLVDVVKQAVTAAHAENVGVTHDSLHGLLNAVLEEHESELAAMVAPFLQSHIDNPATPPVVRQVLDTLAHPEHQTQFFTALFAVRAIIDQFVFAAIAPLVQDVSNQAWTHDPTVPLSPAEAALAVVRNNMTRGEASLQAFANGMAQNLFDVMVANTGNALGVAEALLLYRRGQMDDATLERNILQSHLRDEWLPFVKALRYMPPPAGEVIAGALKGHLGDGDASAKLSEAGIDPANYGWMKATAGRPPGIVEMLSLWNRGKVSESQVDAAIRQSDINDAYLDVVKLYRYYHPPVRSVVAMLRRGSIDDARARQLLAENGVPGDVIDDMIRDGHQQSKQTVKDLTQAQVLRLYGARMITGAEAAFRLEALHYTAGDAADMLALIDEERHERQVNAAASKIRTLFVSWKIDATTATNDLAKVGVPPTAVADWLALWTVERDANVHIPTVAQLGMALRRELLTPDAYRLRMLALGVPAEDVAIFAVDAYPVGKVPAALYTL